MKIYFAATAPGNEKKKNRVGRIFIRRRLLSYYLILTKKLECDKVFNEIIT